MATYSFTPPFVMEGYSVPADGIDERAARFLSGVKKQKGVGLYLEAGLFKETRVITEAMYKGKVDGVDYFKGGHTYTGIPQSVADILILSGYSPVLE